MGRVKKRDKVAKEIAQISREVVECEKNKKYLLKHINKLKDKHLKGDLLYTEYESHLSKELEGKSLPDWIEHYDDFLSESKNKILKLEKSIKKSQNFTKLSYIFVFLVVILGLVYLLPIFTGFITFVPPTPPTQTVIIHPASTIINISIDDYASNNLEGFKWNWNSTNYSFYDSSLYLMLNLDNNAEIGENSSYAVDVSKYGNNATFGAGSAAPSWTTGKYDGALDFDGTADFLRVDVSNDWTFNSEITVSAWIKKDQAGGGGWIVSRWLDTRDSFALVLRDTTQGNFSHFKISNSGDGTTERILSGATQVNDTEWHHIVGTFNGNTQMMYVYLDGIQDRSGSTPFTTFYSTRDDIYIGLLQGTFWFDGKIDEVRIYNRSLSADEVWQQYSSNLKRFNSTLLYFYSNQSNLTIGKTYTYQGCSFYDSSSVECTEVRSLSVGQEISACTNLNISNTTYVLTQNISSAETCINITANNITLDCQGYWINYSYGGIRGSGIYTKDTEKITVKNCHITEGTITQTSKNGVWLRESENATIINNTIITIGTSSSNIMSSGKYNNLIGNKITTLGSATSIYLAANSHNNLIENNSITNQGTTNAIKVDSDNNTLTGNIILTGVDSCDGMDLSGYGSNISNNKIKTLGSTSSGMFIKTKNTLFVNNQIITSGSDGYGLRIESGTDNNIFIDTIISTSGPFARGIFFRSSPDPKNNTFKNAIVNTSGDTSYALYLGNAENNTFTDSSFNASYAGTADIYVDTSCAGEFNFTNVTFSELAHMTNAIGIINVHWYFDVNVSNTTKESVENAQVILEDINANQVVSEPTNSDGRIPRKTVLDYSENSTDSFKSNLHTLSITESGYSNYINSSVNISNNLLLNIEMQSGLSLPQLNFTYPTPPDYTEAIGMSAEINVTIYGESISNVNFSWNGTNYSFYDKDLVLFLNFDNITAIGDNKTYAIDSSRFGNNGTLINNSKLVPGKYGLAADMEANIFGAGPQSIVRIDDSNSLDLIDNFTIVAWVRRKALGTTPAVVYSHINSPAPYYGINFIAGSALSPNLSFYSSGSGTPRTVFANRTIQDNQWHHVAVMYDYPRAYFYFDGEYAGMGGQAQGYPDKSNNYAFIGHNPLAMYSNASIDEIRIYNRSLTETEIKQLYQGNLKKITSTYWEFYANQAIKTGNYTYQACASNFAGTDSTEVRHLNITFTQGITPDAEISSCQELDQAGYYYALTQDVSSGGNCFNILEDGITLDCQGHSINYATLGIHGYGVNLTDHNFATVKNCNINEKTAGSAKHGIYLSNTDNSVIYNNSISTISSQSNNIHFGITSCFNNNISFNTMNTTGAYANSIYLSSLSSGNIIENNSIETRASSIYINSANQNTIRGNSMNSSEQSGIGMYGQIQNSFNQIITSDNLVEGLPVNYTYNKNNLVFNKIDFTQYGQVIFGWCDNIQITNSNFSSDGLSLHQTHNSLIENNNITSDKGFGITIGSHSTNSKVNNNTIRIYGPQLYRRNIHTENAAYPNIISNNTLINEVYTGSAIYLLGDTYSNLTDNKITTLNTNAYGLNLQSSINTFVSRNNITALGENNAGIYIWGGNLNKIQDNNITVTNSISEGISLGITNNNNFTRNNIIVTSPSTAINFYSSTSSNTFSEINIQYTQGGAVVIDSGSPSFSISDSIFNTTQGGDALHVEQDTTAGTFNFTNVTSLNKTYWGPGSIFGTMYTHHYMQFNITNSTQDTLENANITLWNKDGKLIFTELTDGEGTIPKKAILSYLENRTIRLNYSLFTLNVSMPNYENYTNATINLTDNKFFNIQLENGIESIDAPKLKFVWPTLEDTTKIQDNNTEINVTIYGESIKSINWSWNSTNYSFFDKDLVLYLNLDNNTAIGEGDSLAVDSSEYGNDCTFQDNAKWNSSGKYGSNLELDGTLDYLNCGNDASLGLTNKMALSAWIKTGRLGTPMRIISKDSYPTPSYRAYLLQIGFVNEINFGVFKASYVGIASTKTVTDNQWHHVVGVNDGTNLIIYIDGIKNASSPVGGAFDNYPADLYIGAYYQSGIQGEFTGLVDEVRIYNRSLTEDEVWQHYQSNLKKFNSTYWEFYSKQNLARGNYTYQTCASNSAGINCTEVRYLNSTYVPFTPPQINFTPPTPPKHYETSDLSTEINVTITGKNISNITWNWNGTNYSFYDDSLVLHLDFDDFYGFDVGSNLKGFWHFDEESGNLFDHSGNGNTLTNNGAEYTASGKHGNALNFVRANGDDLIRNDDDDFEPGANEPFSVCGWFQTDLANTQQVIVSKQDATSYDGWAVWLWNSGQLYFQIDEGAGNSRTYGATTTIDDGNWHHFCAVRTAAGFPNVYVDGHNDYSSNVGGNMASAITNTNALKVGARDSVSEYNFDGTIDEVIYLDNTALTESEILMLNNSKIPSDNSLYSNDVRIWTVFGPYNATGKHDSGMNFDGGTSSINSTFFIQDSPSLDITGPITLEAWVKPTSYPASQARIISKGTDKYILFYGSTGIPYMYNDGLSETTVAWSSALPLNEWSHIIGTYNATDICISVNGASLKCDSSTGSISTDDDVLTIGSYKDGAFEMNGSIDEVRIYNRSLSADEVWQHYQSNLKKLNSTYWEFYTSQSPVNGNYTYQACASNPGGINCTEIRYLNISHTAIPLEIIYVSSIPSVAPSAGSYRTLSFSAHVYDQNGVSNIDTNSVRANLTLGVETPREDLQCEYIGNLNQQTANFSCSVNMWYWDSNGTWIVKVTALDLESLSAVNSSTTFLYGITTAYELSTSLVDFGSLIVDQINASAGPVMLNNSGNFEGIIIINATNLTGETNPSDYIMPENFSISGRSRTVIFGESDITDFPGTLNDTYLDISNSTHNNLETMSIWSWSWIAPHKISNTILIKSDITAIPQGANITRARLELFQVDAYTSDSTQTNNQTTTIHPIINKNPVIQEAAGFNSSAVELWTAVPPDTVQNDYPLALADIGQAEDLVVVNLSNATRGYDITKMVQSWIDDPSSNRGLLIKGGETTRQNGYMFASSENLNTSIRPKLIITYETGAQGEECRIDNTLSNLQKVNIIDTYLPRGNLSLGGQIGREEIYYCIRKVPSGLAQQKYSTVNGWNIEITIALVAVTIRRKRKKKDNLKKAIDLLTEELKGNIEDKEQIINLLTLENIILEKKQRLIKQISGLEESKTEIKIPINIFSADLGALEVLSKYLKENLNLSYKEISKLLDRNERTIWSAYSKARKKMEEKLKVDKKQITINISELESKDLTVLEALILSLKSKNFKYSEIARLLNRDQRNIWTIYSRAVSKTKEKHLKTKKS
ncbi:MAG: LamG-like jellyroll fold domain-containing protein [archaeon]